MKHIPIRHYAALALAVCAIVPNVQARAMSPATSLADPATSRTAIAPTVDRLNGIDYMSGGIGAEERAGFEAAKAKFDAHFLFTAERDGEYVAGVKVAVRDHEGRTVFDLRDAGPMLWIQLPAGTYTVEAAYDGRTEKTTVRVGDRRQATAHTFHWTGATAQSSHHRRVAG